jgi:hypothetical protein
MEAEKFPRSGSRGFEPLTEKWGWKTGNEKVVVIVGQWKGNR